jgi:hypothetical protein
LLGLACTSLLLWYYTLQEPTLLKLLRIRNYYFFW